MRKAFSVKKYMLQRTTPALLASGLLLVFFTWLTITTVAQDHLRGSAPRSHHSFRHDSTSSQDQKPKHRLREGTELTHHPGFFKPDGEGAVFVSQENGIEMAALPNLNLERVVRTLKTSDDPESIRWNVNGTVTEFHSQNYLLISRAVYRMSTPPPLPEQLGE